MQLRTYETATGLPVVTLDEYAQALGLMKLSRQLAPRYSVSGQIEWSRNGGRQSGTFYSKRVFSLALETVL